VPFVSILQEIIVTIKRVNVFLERKSGTNFKKKLTALETKRCAVGWATFTFRNFIMLLQNKENKKKASLSVTFLSSPSFCS
jgi:hypothetical protein